MVTRTCRTCSRDLPVADFHCGGGRKNPDGTCRYWRLDCKRCAYRKRRTPGAATVRPRVNGRGYVWCYRCKAYLHPQWFYRAADRAYGSYCKTCNRAAAAEGYQRRKRATMSGLVRTLQTGT